MAAPRVREIPTGDTTQAGRRARLDALFQRVLSEITLPTLRKVHARAVELAPPGQKPKREETREYLPIIRVARLSFRLRTTRARRNTVSVRSRY